MWAVGGATPPVVVLLVGVLLDFLVEDETVFVLVVVDFLMPLAS